MICIAHLPMHLCMVCYNAVQNSAIIVAVAADGDDDDDVLLLVFGL